MTKSPIWIPTARLAHLGLTANTRAWLLAPGSTTKLFNTLSQSPMQVRCLQQRWQAPLRAETESLGLPSYRQILLREVEHVPWEISYSESH
jgi:chorismate-pyruvate lyase